MPRSAIYTNRVRGKAKPKRKRIQGLMTDHAWELFRNKQRELAASTGRKLSQVSHGDVVEYLLRGWANTVDHVAGDVE